MRFRILIAILTLAVAAFAQSPSIEPGVSHELAKWRAARYSDVRYKLNLTLEKMSPVLKGTIEIRVKVDGVAGDKNSPPYEGGVDAALGGRGGSLIVLDWRKIRGYENLSTVSAVTINGRVAENHPVAEAATPLLRKEGSQEAALTFIERNDHLIFQEGVVMGENVIKLDFTSPILTSGSAITRYVDKEDGAEYIYSLFVPSDASTAFPVFDQPDLKARFTLTLNFPTEWAVVSNSEVREFMQYRCAVVANCLNTFTFDQTKPISTYVFAFAAGPWERVSVPPAVAGGALSPGGKTPPATAGGTDPHADLATSIYVRKSQATKFKPHSAEVFRLNREGVKFLESYFDYKFPFPKYDLVLIPEFPFGGMEHAGATFLRESSVIFPQEPTKNDYISRANVIFHEAAHQWFGDTVTMKWFDDLWLKEGFAEFMAYKTLEKVMPEVNAWKVFFERNKQAAYLTDSTKGTTPIYQEIDNLNSAKSAYGNIVYRKAPSFLKQAEFYLGPEKFQTAVRAFLKKHEYANAGWEDLLNQFEAAGGKDLKDWANIWVKKPGVPVVKVRCYEELSPRVISCAFRQLNSQGVDGGWIIRSQILRVRKNGRREIFVLWMNNIQNDDRGKTISSARHTPADGSVFEFLNYEDYGYGIFLLDDKSRDYVLKNIGSEKDDFLRTMMWGSLWDSVREGELDPKEYVELVVRNIKLETDESTVQTLLGRVSTAMRYYLSEPPALAGGTNVATKQAKVKPRSNSPSTVPPAYASGSDLLVETLLIDRMQNASTPGQKITYYRAFLNIASSENARRIMKKILNESGNSMQKPAREQGLNAQRPSQALPNGRASALSVTTKDKFDIVSKLIILGDPDAPKLLADLERTETSDEAKRYAYGAKAGFATAENKAKFWTDFVANKEISESWIEAAFGPFNNVRHSALTLPYLEKALAELPNLKRSRKIFFVNGWLGAFIGGQKSEAALAIVNKFLADNPNLDKDLRLKILENVDLIERAVRIRGRFGKN